MLQARWVPQPRHGLEQSRCLGALPLPAWVPCLPTQNPPGEPEEPPPNPVTGWASKGVTRAPRTASLSHPHGGHGDSSAQAPLPSQGGKPGGPQYPPACSKPCCHFPTCPQHPGAPLYLPACGWPIHPAASALQLEKTPPSLQEPPGDGGASSLSLDKADPEQQHRASSHHGQGQEPPALAATKQLPQVREDGGTTGRSRQVHSGM